MKISSDRTAPATWRRVLVPVLGSRLLHWLALLALCAAYLQGGLNKALDFDAAVAEMRHFKLEPAAPIAAATIALEIGASLLILSGYLRWLAALALAGFTLMASFLANPFWSAMPPNGLPWPMPSSNISAWSADFCWSPGRMSGSAPDRSGSAIEATAVASDDTSRHADTAGWRPTALLAPMETA